jgi:hypothetical protein
LEVGRKSLWKLAFLLKLALDWQKDLWKYGPFFWFRLAFLPWHGELEYFEVWVSFSFSLID